jgi:hypothetical protein
MRGERQLVEQIRHNSLFRWFAGLAIDGRTTRPSGYGVSEVVGKPIEEHFGWGKTIGRIRQAVCLEIQQLAKPVSVA